MPQSAHAPLICIIAGEPSGDLLGARLIAALKRATEGQVRFLGVGGEAMQTEGVESLVDIADLAVMGFAEVLPRLVRILGHVETVTKAIEAARPDVVVTIDSWGFTGRVQKALQRRLPEIPRVHYVAPMVWAWKEKRAEAVARTVDCLLCLLPNEPRYFERYGLSAVHVGHPVVEGGASRGDGAGFRRDKGIAETAPLLCVLPGSRRGEVTRLMPLFRDAVAGLAKSRPGLRVTIPTVATVRSMVEAQAKTWPVPVTVVQGEAARYDAFAASDAALAASGTVSLELALAGVPHAIAYRVSAVTAWIFRRLATLRYVDLVNILLDRPVVPELLQEACTPERLIETVEALLDDTKLRANQKQAFGEAMSLLGAGEESPSDRAAFTILNMITNRRDKA